MSAYDLHFHSTASDGGATLATVQAAVAARPDLDLVVLADHDTLGYSPQLAATEPRARVGLETVATNGRGVAEFVAINVDPSNRALLDYLAAREAERTSRFLAWGERLRALGFVFAPPADVLRDPTLTKSHVFTELRRHRANDDLFARYKIGPAGTDPAGHFRDPAGKLLTPEGPAALAGDQASAVRTPEDLIALIHHAGGRAVLAHPYWNPLAQMKGADRTFAAARELVQRWKRAGLDGIEVFHRDQRDPFLQDILLRWAAQLELLVGIGSDDHSANLDGLGGEIDPRDPRLPAWYDAWMAALDQRP
jgi:predicted metal-dependent phosphoesterase TrpH